MYSQRERNTIRIETEEGKTHVVGGCFLFFLWHEPVVTSILTLRVQQSAKS